ncbi:biopolymer transporter ExbD [Vibrio sp. 10N.261.46.A3]|uniref:biopolymer transporter ExbD n=1 Tax=Vibrio sp. 10N.261.46.A3 TaxID=3229658 RepID=UPI00354BD694
MNISFKTLTVSRKNKRGSALNLVALMDIFTVLVFFLLFNVHDDQVVELGSNIDSLPLSEQATDELKEALNVQVLELPSQSQAYFAGEAISLSDGIKGLSEFIHNHCKVTEGHCRLLAIQAPPDMPYPFVNKFVELGRKLGFENVYLVVVKK